MAAFKIDMGALGLVMLGVVIAVVGMTTYDYVRGAPLFRVGEIPKW